MTELTHPAASPRETRAPTATDGSVSFNEDSSGAITLAGSDPDGTPIDHYVIDALPSHGTLLLNGKRGSGGRFGEPGGRCRGASGDLDPRALARAELDETFLTPGRPRPRRPW